MCIGWRTFDLAKRVRGRENDREEDQLVCMQTGEIIHCEKGNQFVRTNETAGSEFKVRIWRLGHHTFAIRHIRFYINQNSPQ